MGDNVYHVYGCPPKMQDGRHLTDYQPKDSLDEYYQHALGAADEHDYRAKLQAKAEDIIRDSMLTQIKANTCKCSGAPCQISPVALPPSTR